MFYLMFCTSCLFLVDTTRRGHSLVIVGTIVPNTRKHVLDVKFQTTKNTKNNNSHLKLISTTTVGLPKCEKHVFDPKFQTTKS